MSGNSARNTAINGIHHLAFGTKSSKYTYEFYAEKLGMPLVRTENHRQKGGYFRHYFFDMGRDQYLGFFEIHDVGENEEYRTDLSTGLGMPIWVNHIAFDVGSKENFDLLNARCEEKGIAPRRVADHGWCQSLYMVDPNMIMVEFVYTCDPKAFRDQTPEQAYDLLFNTPKEDIPEESRKKSTKVGG
ncbi:hypothetical protein A9Q99_16410 [Gammaproteobacteria bacterium 45_16_T64]|nr:hypothetical protein A9Q99_16410 [Gammaproteobacteria bacterium 45_16_T64]